MGMAVSRGTFCCNVQDLFHFLGIGCARGFQKITNTWQTIMKMAVSPSERVPPSAGFEILKGEGEGGGGVGMPLRFRRNMEAP